MKTVFMQRIIALAIVTASITSTFGTPLPRAASQLRVRDVPLLLSVDSQLTSASLSEYRERLGEVTSTEFDVTHAFQITPRDSITFTETKSKLESLGQTCHREPNRENVDKFLTATIAAYGTLVELEGENKNKAKLEQFKTFVTNSINVSLDCLEYALSHERTSGIDSSLEGDLLIQRVIQIALMLKSASHPIGAERRVVNAIDNIINFDIPWLHDNYKNQLKEDKEELRKIISSPGGGQSPSHA
ncbi:hypothetical protein H0H93_007784 [Arthromyces matolae]|nr:hypothetical protein H0H93_007784 [Arthromyces matolae]